MPMKSATFALAAVIAAGAPVLAQPAGDLRSAVALFQNVRIAPNIVYERANGWEGKLDVYVRNTANGSVAPVVIFIHGGGWVRGTKEGSALQGILPYLAMGYSVVNVEYRLGNVSLAPAAIEDCRCALRWVVEHAKDYRFDVDRIVVAGASAGGHLALMTGMIPTTAGFDRSCLTPADPRVAAIVDLFGITDVADLLDGPNKKPFPETWPYAVQWLGNQPNREQVARMASPLTYVRSGVPPTISIHGDADPLVPYNHSVRLQEALEHVGVAHVLVTVAGGGHGDFSPDEWQRAFRAIDDFLSAHVSAKP
jgi:acetyl esterase/lipase